MTGTATSLSLAATGGIAPYTWSATGLPAGLTVNTTTGVISGTPTTAANLTVNVTATDAGQRTNTATFAWNISGPITVANVFGQVGPTGVAYSKALTATGGTAPYRWTAAGLPAGLSLDPASGVISGTPTTAGNSVVKVTVTDKDGLTGATSFPVATGVIVTYPADQGNATGTPITPLAIKAAGGTGTYTWTATGLPTGLSIDAATGSVTSTPTAAGNYTAMITAVDTAGTSGATSFTWTIVAAPELTNPGTVHATTGVALSHQLTATGGKAPYTWTATGLPTGLSIKPDTGQINGTASTATSSNVTVTLTDAMKTTKTVTFMLIAGTPVIALNPGTRTNTVGTAIPALTLTTDGGTGPYTWSLTGLPAGLTATAAGVISGTPTTTVATTVAASVVDNAGRTATTSFTWTITGPVTVTNPGMQTGTVGIDTTLALAATGGTGGFQWTATDLPTGLTIDLATGTVSGKPASAGSWTATITATDTTGGTATTSVTWTVATALTAITPTKQTTRAGQTATLTLAASGGTAPYAWTVDGLPDGLTLDPNSGIVTGTPTDATAGTTVTATVTDTAGRTDRVFFTWIVELSPPITLTAQPDGVQTVQLTWTAVTGATNYGIYRNGARIADTTATTLTDAQLDGATSYQYRVTAISGEGLETATSSPATVTTLPTPASPENYTTCTTGCSYTVSIPADPARPDTARQLIDGIRGPLDAGTGWQARPATNQYAITADLGTSRPITEITSTWLQKQNQDIDLPLTVVYAFSNDGTNFTDLALITRPYVSDTDQIKAYRAVGLAETARYVRATINGSSGWSLADEIEVRGVVSGTQPPLTLSTPTPGATGQGQEISALQVTVTDQAGPFTWTADGLPPGLTAGRTSGVISGTARTPGTFTAIITATSTGGRTGRTTFSWTVFAAPAAGPVMDSSMVFRFGVDTRTGGVAVLDGFAYTVVGYRLVKFDIAAGKDAVAQSVAGGDSACRDGGSGDQVRFSNAYSRVIGTDGSLIYVSDPACVGLRIVNPKTGATRSVNVPATGASTIAGRYLYAISFGKISRYDLQAGQTTRLFDNLTFNGALAADDTHLWVLNDDDRNLWGLPLNGTGETKTFPLPAGGITAARSAGAYVYYTDSRNLLTRISKTDGTLLMVAGDAARTGKLLSNTSGIATDGTFVLTAGEPGLAKVTSIVRTFARPATGPILDSGKVTQYGPDSYASGVTILDGYAYVGMGYKLVRYNLKDGADASPEDVAGSDTYGCVDADKGGLARFNQAHVITNDTEKVYVTDPSCGLRSVNAKNGATRKIGEPVGRSSVVVNNRLYSADNYGKIWQHNLDSGDSPRKFTDAIINGPIAADDDYLWAFSGSGKLYGLAFDRRRNVDREFAMPGNAVFAALSVGEFVYFVDGRHLLSRINKNDGSLQIVAGDGAFDDDLLYITMGIAADGNNIYTAGEHGLYVITKETRWFDSQMFEGEGPFLGAGAVQSTVTSNLSGERWGIASAVIRGQFAATASRATVSVTDIQTGVTIPVADGIRSGCTDGKREEATFYNASVVGGGGSLIYILDSGCGLRAV